MAEYGVERVGIASSSYATRCAPERGRVAGAHQWLFYNPFTPRYAVEPTGVRSQIEQSARHVGLEHAGINPEHISRAAAGLIDVRQGDGGSTPLPPGSLPDWTDERESGDGTIHRSKDEPGIGEGEASLYRWKAAG
jgi:hypothetical protein